MQLNERTILFFGLLIVGIGLEAIKIWPARTLPNPVDNGALALSKPYSVSDEERALTTTILPHQTPQPATAKIAEFDLNAVAEAWKKDQAKAKEEEKKKKTVKGWKWVWNKEQQKWVWKKIKKKKTEKKDEAIASDLQSSKPTPAKTAKTDATPPQGLVTAQDPNDLYVLTRPAASRTATPHTFLTLDQWKKRLLTTPDTAETKIFIQQYKQHLVTEEVFYEIVALMLKDSRTTMQTEGMLALSSTPSVKSFEQIVAKQSTEQTSSPLYQTETQALATYSQLTNLDVLKEVLAAGPSSAVLSAALTQLNTAITANLTSSTSDPSAQGAKNISYFSGFSALLAKLSTNSDQSISNQAQTAESALLANQIKS
jgi:hypothetical protein